MPTEIKALIDKALKFHQSGNLTEAEKIYLEVIKNSPQNASALNLLGLLKLQQNKMNEAVNYIKQATEIHPSAYLYGNLGRAYYESKNFDESIKSYKKALVFDNQVFDTWFNIGLAYKKTNQFDKAIEAYNQALLIKPKDVSTYFNLGNLYEDINETLKAIENYEKAYEYSEGEPDNDIKYFLGICYIKAKNYKKGIPLHEFRPSKPFATFSQKQLYPEIGIKPLWDGSKLEDKTIFVYYESALGDTLMYVRYLELLKNKFKKVFFQPQLCFTDLFKENNFGATIIDSKLLPKDVIFDVHIPLMSIPYVLGLHTEEIPLAGGYIKANVTKSSEYKDKYFNNNKFKIGIKWMGNTANDLNRIITIESFNKILDLPNTQFYSLQRDEGIEELKKIPKEFNVIDLGETFNDFSDTAAAIDNLDLVICNDTSIAHLAGAMGKPCWIILPFVQNWRWHTDLSHSPWYKSVKLFKQETPGIWDGVFEKLKTELKRVLSV